MAQVDLDGLRPAAAEVELVAGLLVEIGPATTGDLLADLGLPFTTVAGALRTLERAGRACRDGRVWLAVTPSPRRQRRSWKVGSWPSA
jgi:hypothetical protein